MIQTLRSDSQARGSGLFSLQIKQHYQLYCLMLCQICRAQFGSRFLRHDLIVDRAKLGPLYRFEEVQLRKS
jgi:hypothetical protein